MKLQGAEPTEIQLQKIAYCEEILLRPFVGKTEEDAYVWLQLNLPDARKLDSLQQSRRNRKGKAYWKGLPQQQRLMGFTGFQI